MITQTVTVEEKNAQNIIIGRRGTYNTEEIVFDMTALVESFGSGSAVLMVKRPMDSTAYPAVTEQDGSTLTWTVSETDTSYKGHGECELFWYVDSGLAKSVIWSLTVLRDIGTTTEEPPDPYETWVESLTALGAETLQNAQNAAQSASEAEGYADDAGNAKDAAEAAQEAAEQALEQFTHPTASANTLAPGSAATADYSNGHFTFGIPQGIQGETGQRGETGATGADGYSPTATVSKSGNETTITITDKNGTTTATVNDGVIPTIDSALSTTSENPVQNKVVTAALNEKAAIITDTASGAIASFPDGADGMPIKSLVAQIDPVQDLNGYDNPWPAGGGKNKLPFTVGTRTISGVTFTVNNDGSVSANGTATANVNFGYASFTPGAGEYVLNGNTSGSSSSTHRMRFRVANGSWQYHNTTGDSTAFTVDGSETFELDLSVLSGATVSGIKFYPMIRLASETDATYAPYSNICPISGHTGCEVQRTGVNVWDEEWESGEINTNTGADATSTTRCRSKNYISIKPSASYYILAPSANVYLFFYDRDKNYLGFHGTNRANQAVVPVNLTNAKDASVSFATAEYMRFRYDTTTADGVSINYPSTDTAYHAYSGTSLPISWQSEAGTVYGGELTINEDGSCVLTVDRAMVDLSTLSWVYDASTYAFQFLYADLATCASNDITSSIYKTAVTSDEFMQNDFRVRFVSSNHRLRVRDSRYSSSAAFVDGIAGETLCYPLATPQTYTLPSVTMLETILGTNNVWCDTGAIEECSYSCDTRLFILKKIAEALSS